MLNDITIVKCEVMSHLVRLRGKDTVQCAHCALVVYNVHAQGMLPILRFWTCLHHSTCVLPLFSFLAGSAVPLLKFLQQKCFISSANTALLVTGLKAYFGGWGFWREKIESQRDRGIPPPVQHLYPSVSSPSVCTSMSKIFSGQNGQPTGQTRANIYRKCLRSGSPPA